MVMIYGQSFDLSHSRCCLRLFANGTYAILLVKKFGIFLAAYSELSFTFLIAKKLFIILTIISLIRANSFRIFSLFFRLMALRYFLYLFRIAGTPSVCPQFCFLAIFSH